MGEVDKIYLIVTPFFPSETNFRGPFVYDMAKAISRTGCYGKVVVFKGVNNFKHNTYVYEGIGVYEFPFVGFPSYLFNGVLNPLNSRLFLRALRKAGFRAQDIAVVHGHTSSYGSLCISLKRKNADIVTVLHHHDPDPYTIRNGIMAQWMPNLYIRARINLKLFEKLDLHVCVSEYVKDNLQAFPRYSDKELFGDYKLKTKKLASLGLKKMTNPNCIVLYNGVDLSKFPLKNGRHSDKFTIGSIGNFVDWKNQITLLKAIDILVKQLHINDIRCILIGSGPMREECERYVADNCLNEYVEFRNELFHADLHKFYQKIDLFCLPSYFEGFGCVFTEAAACGTPFIVGLNQGASEYIYPMDSDKWIVNPFDEIDVAKKIEGYYKGRYTQSYRFSLDINVLVGEFLNRISSMQK